MAARRLAFRLRGSWTFFEQAFRRGIALFCVSLAVIGAVPPALAADDRQSAALRQISLLDQKIAAIGHRLSLANVGRCDDRAYLPGFTVHDLSQYSGSFRETAIALFGLDSGPRILAAVPGGAADRAGLRPGDRLLTVDGATFPIPAADGNRTKSKAGIEAIEEAMLAGFGDGEARVAFARDGQTMTLQIVGDPGCATRFHLEPSSQLNARADGTYVVVTTAISGVVRSDDELAAVLAHELAHNVLRHRAYLDATGRRASNVRATEIAADRASIRLLHDAGYDPGAAITFWQHFGPRRKRLFAGSHHPGWRDRVAIMEDEIARLREAE